jgi:4-hydroxybenzoate polyprenyltransferase
MWGFGTLTPYAGWAATGLGIDLPRALVLLAFCPLFAALYPLTQLYQLEEDRRRGDRTLAVVIGARRSLDASLVAAALAFGLFAAAGARSGWTLDGGTWRWAALAVALGAWAFVLIPWRLAAERYRSPEHQRGMYLALGAWAITDVAVLAAWGI